MSLFEKSTLQNVTNRSELVRSQGRSVGAISALANTRPFIQGCVKAVGLVFQELMNSNCAVFERLVEEWSGKNVFFFKKSGDILADVI